MFAAVPTQVVKSGDVKCVSTFHSLNLFLTDIVYAFMMYTLSKQIWKN